MAYILAEQRDSDVAAAFRAYADYLTANASRFPPSAYQLATAAWYFDFADRRCPHDAWLESLTLTEPSRGSRSETRSSALTVRLLGAYHDGHIEFVYQGVRGYLLAAPFAIQGHGDWRYDEFRATEDGGVIHEIEWAAFGHTGRWVIEAADVTHRWIAK